MYQKFKAWLLTQLSTPENISSPAYFTGTTGQIEHETAQNVVLYDENLLERSRIQWQFGDWESLAKLERDTLQHRPDRAKLALLAAAGHLQQGNSQVARQFTRQQRGLTPLCFCCSRLDDAATRRIGARIVAIRRRN